MAEAVDRDSGACRSGSARNLTNHQNVLVPMQPLLDTLRCALDRVLQGALPDDSHAPAKSVKHLSMAGVTSNILLEFLPPEVGIGLGIGRVAAAFMSVPKTTVDEYHRPVLWKHEIGAAGQRRHMKSVAKSSGKKKGTKHPLGLGVLSANARHHAAALRRGRNAHCLGYLPAWISRETAASHVCPPVRADHGGQGKFLELTMCLTRRKSLGGADGS